MDREFEMLISRMSAGQMDLFLGLIASDLMRPAAPYPAIRVDGQAEDREKSATAPIQEVIFPL